MAFQVERFQGLRWKPKNIRSSWKVLRNRLELLILSLFVYHFFEGGGERGNAMLFRLANFLITHFSLVLCLTQHLSTSI